MIDQLRLVPNQLTAARLVLLPILWALALRGDGVAVGVGLAVSFFLDFSDGFVARRLGQTSSFGSKFDSAVDAFIGPSAIVWLLLIEPSTILDHLPLAIAWFALTYVSIAVGLIKFRRFANLHLRSSRVACVIQYAFLVDAFVAPPYQPVLLYAAAGAGIVSSLETLLLQLARPRVDEHLVSLVPAARRAR
ncbi:MAG TPA: CDP-alcohol phosphatidyltransferase family protein [Gaiellaceae bacterium]|nr:CDP-alcohol phosphatidyltransferase family protein [Gaiellaceae bacterium]